jgi:hypothetical protein
MANTLKLIIIIIALLFICVENINAQEEQITIPIIDTSEQTKENDNTRISIYFHPYTLFGTIFTFVNSPTPILFLYATLEVPLSSSNSLIIKPSL